MMWSLYNLLRS